MGLSEARGDAGLVAVCSHLGARCSGGGKGQNWILCSPPVKVSPDRL